MLCSVNNNSFIIPPAPLGQRKVADGPGEEQMLVLPSPKRNRAPPLWASGAGEQHCPISDFFTNKEKSKLPI